MEENYDLTIIMSNYNQEEYISKAIESVFSQIVNFKFQLIIADDYSCNDRSKEIIKKYADKYENIETIFSSSNQGYLANVLKAKSKAKTKYICLLDADDYWTDEYFLQRAFDFLNTHDDYSIYEGNVAVASADENGNEIIKRPFLSKKYKSGTYSKEMLLNNVRIPITQTTGMFLRNTIFSDDIPEIMTNAIGTRSERAFEGDTGRFIMHLKTGLAYYDKRIIGVYRLNPRGIWSSMSQSMKCLVSSRAYIDYYVFYECNVSFFVSKAYALLQRYVSEKKNELEIYDLHEKFIDEKELLLIEDIYQFCRMHEKYIVLEKNGWICKIKRMIKIILS